VPPQWQLLLLLCRLLLVPLLCLLRLLVVVLRMVSMECR
jgi:hypothetical protein